MSCGSHPSIQCETMSDCNLHFGGKCTSAPTGNQWCSYPDPSCPSGMRYSDQQVGDGVSGQCVGVVNQDAGIDAPTTPASCVALPHNCGASGSDSCCNSLLAPEGGAYYRGFDVAADIYSGNQNYPATVSNFLLDKYEITVGRFRAFVAAHQGTQENPPAVGAGTHPKLPGSGWEATWNTNLLADAPALMAALKCDATFQTWTDTPGANENRPINCITWYEAMAFCIWDNGYLPTDAEWNYAASGGDEQRVYPWSMPPGTKMLDGSHASYSISQGGGVIDCVGDGMPGCAVTDLVKVGTLPQGDARWGHSELGGNVSEWVLDWYDVQYRNSNPCVDCADLTVPATPPQARALRGGAYIDPLYAVRSDFRANFAEPAQRVEMVGARCARAP